MLGCQKPIIITLLEVIMSQSLGGTLHSTPKDFWQTLHTYLSSFTPFWIRRNRNQILESASESKPGLLESESHDAGIGIRIEIESFWETLESESESESKLESET